MTLVSVLIVILIFVIVGVVLNLVNTRVTMNGTVKTILNYTVWALLIVWAGHLLGVWDLLNVRINSRL